MGVRGLTKAVRPYGSHASLRGRQVVIDGPALVHRIYEGCLVHRTPHDTTWMCQPSYDLVNSLLVAWLDYLVLHQVTVRKIYFDGFLPPSKWGTRRHRLREQSQRLKKTDPRDPSSGPPHFPDKPFDSVQPDLSLTQDCKSRVSLGNLPKPPFQVPASIEYLKASPVWCHLVEVVPGEADLFCAEDVRRHGGDIFTADSDLLLSDLGPDGRVVFFGDIVLDDPAAPSPELSALVFSHREINEKLGFEHQEGFLRAVFEFQMARMTFGEAVHRAKELLVDNTTPDGFPRFMASHQATDFIRKDHPTIKQISAMDPRISELVVQALIMDDNGIVSVAENKTSRGPEAMSMFLPIMIECREMRSAWSASTGLRQLAYGLLQTLATHKSETIIEYRLLDASNPNTGRQCHVPDSQAVIDDCVDLVVVLETLHRKTAVNHWLSFSIYQEVQAAMSEGKTALALALLSEDRDYEYSWEYIHLSAQIQACFYSFRLLKQVIAVVEASGTALAEPVKQLRGFLNTLPPIGDWPSLDVISKAPGSLITSEVLDAAAAGLDVPIDDITKQIPQKPKKRKRVQQDNSAQQRTTGRSGSTNPFAALDGV